MLLMRLLWIHGRAQGTMQMIDLSFFFFFVQVGRKNQQNASTAPLSLDAVLRIKKDAFTSATERDIHTGDNLQIFIVTRDGVEEQNYPLKKD